MRSRFGKLFDLLTRQERYRLLALFAMVLIMAILEMVGVASIIPFVAVMANPGVVKTNKYLSIAYEHLGFQNTEDFLFFLGVVVFALVIGSTVFKALTTWALLRYVNMLNHALSCRLFQQYLQRPYEWFLSRHSADLGKSLLQEVGQSVNGALMPAMQLVAQGLMALLLIFLLLFVDPLLAISVSVVLGGAYWLILWTSRHYVYRIGEDRLRANRERFRESNEALGGIKDVKVLGLERTFLRRFATPSLRFSRRNVAAQMIGQMPQYALQALTFGGMLVIIQYQLLTHGGVGQALPLIALYAVAGYRLLPALQRMYQSASALRFSAPAVNDLHRDLVEQALDPRRKETAERSEVQPLHLRERLELRDMRYRYPAASTPALKDITIAIPARATVGLVGATGAGKTTLVDVMLGLLDVEGGQMLVDGVPITASNRRAWQRSLGYVPQSIFLIDDSIAANIAFGARRDEIDMAAVEQAARVSNLHDFVVGELPKGYDTIIGERGIRLSGGQRQRVGIARALYQDPDVLVMDEATSALDNITERAVMDAVGNLARRKTIILIAHRLTTVQACDKIFLLDHGRVVASGTYDELVVTNERFRAMAQNPARAIRTRKSAVIP